MAAHILSYIPVIGSSNVACTSKRFQKIHHDIIAPKVRWPLFYNAARSSMIESVRSLLANENVHIGDGEMYEVLRYSTGKVLSMMISSKRVKTSQMQKVFFERTSHTSPYYATTSLFKESVIDMIAFCESVDVRTCTAFTKRGTRCLRRGLHNAMCSQHAKLSNKNS